MVKSKITGREYNETSCVYVVNMLQAARYMKNGAHEFLVDILYDGVKREDTLVFVFEKNDIIKDLYKKWNAHELH